MDKYFRGPVESGVFVRLLPMRLPLLQTAIYQIWGSTGPGDYSETGSKTKGFIKHGLSGGTDCQVVRQKPADRECSQ